MDDIKRARIKRLTCLIPLALIAGITVFVLRGPHISNALKKIILPELEMALGRKVIAQQIYVNIFPLFVEAKGLKVFDEKGERILVIARTKAYADLSGLFEKKIGIRRLVIKEPELTADRKQAEEIAGNVKSYLAKVRDTAFKVRVRAVEIQKGNILFNDMGYGVVSGIKGLDGEIIVGVSSRIMATAQQFSVKKNGLPEISGDAEVMLSLKDDNAEIKKIRIGVLGSVLKGTGEVNRGKMSFASDMELLVSSVKKLFGLRSSGSGKITAKGMVTDFNRRPAVDLQIDGGFYLQTLMELLKAKEKVEGFIDLSGVIRGPVDDIRGNGTAILQKGNLFDVDVDYLKCAVSYADRRMSFTNGTGRLYNGTARVSASISLPVVDNYTLDIDFDSVDSRPVFRLIGWDPGIEAGKITGNLKNAGSEFNPEGAFEYRSTEKGRDVLGRVREITGTYKKQGPVVSLAGLKLSTGLTDVSASGKADIEKKTLDFDGSLKTTDITDISSPYYGRLKGGGEFKGRITGTTDDPVLSGKIRVLNPALDNNKAELIDTDIVYRKAVLEIKDMSIRNNEERYSLNGSIFFRKAKELFDLSEPEYRLTASIRNSGIGKFVNMFHGGFVGTGKLNSDIRIGGRNGEVEISGDASIEKATLYNIALDSAFFEWRYANDKFIVANLRAACGKSVLSGEAMIGSDSFSYKANADRILLSDLVQREMKGDAVFSLKSEGHGTFDNPEMTVEARIIEGRLKGKPVGGGLITAGIKDKNISVKADMLDDRIGFTARGRLEKEIPWEGRLDLRPGRYDSLISSFLKDVPEDFILSLTAAVNMHGDRKHIAAKAAVKQLALSMYGYSFTNEKEINLELDDKKLIFDKVSMRSGNTSLLIDGSLVLGQQYNLSLEGNSALSPFKSLSAKIGLLKGDAEFVISVTGDWETPQINGGVNLANGSFGLKEYPHRLSSLNGYLFVDNDRVVLQRLSGKLGGGDVELSGVVYLQKFSFKRFYVEAALKDITISVSSEFSVNFGGSILYKGTPAARQISGDLKINRARYRERVEWKSWILKAKKTEKYKAEISDLEKAELNIRLSAKDSIRIDNNVARALMGGEMILRGTIYRPILFGRLESGEGTVYLRNNEFRILHANADFADPNSINPFVNVAAETVVKGYKIRMNLEGQIDHFTMSVSSDPLLKESDIFSLLTVGQLGGETKGLEGGIGASEATSFVTGQLQDVAEERFRSITGLDRFQIDPHVSKKTGTVQPRVTVSKRVLADKLFVTYASSVGSTEEQIIKLEYFLSKHVSLVGGRDERGIAGADIQFRFHYK